MHTEMCMCVRLYESRTDLKRTLIRKTIFMLIPCVCVCVCVYVCLCVCLSIQPCVCVHMHVSLCVVPTSCSFLLGGLHGSPPLASLVNEEVLASAPGLIDEMD